MKRYIIYVAIVVSFFILCLNGCSYVNQQHRENFTRKLSDVKTKIIKGVTKKEEILDLLGDPVGNKKFNTWNYNLGYTEITAWDFGGELLGITPDPTGESYTLYIYFDENGIVKDYGLKKLR